MCKYHIMMKFLLLCICAVIVQCDQITNETEPFVATHEWQVINKDQAIPKGLHVRINLSTGLKEAKLLTDDEHKQRALSVVEQDTPAKETKLDVNSIKEAIKNIPNEAEHEAKIKQKFRSLDELKATLQGYDLSIKSESDMIAKLLTRYKDLGDVSSENTPEIINILQDLEYLVHNYDNGMEFIKLKGVETVILQNIGNQTDDIIINTLELLGACMQNNQNVQKIIFSHNIGPQLLKLIELGTNKVKSKAIYALGCLTRRYPQAQRRLIIEVGHEILNKILNDFQEPDMKVKLRIITLVHDLISERSQDVDYTQMLSSIDFCLNIGQLIVYNHKHFLGEHDNLEKLLVALNDTTETCKNKMPLSNSFKEAISEMIDYYFELAVEEQKDESKDDIDNPEYFKNMLKLLDGLMKNLEINAKQEL